MYILKKFYLLLFLSRALNKLMKYNPDTTEITRPSELLFSVRAYMNVIQNIGNYGKSKGTCQAIGYVWL